MVAVVFQNLRAKGGRQANANVGAARDFIQAKIHAEVLDMIGIVIFKMDRARQSLLMPNREGLFPEAEIGNRRAVTGLIMHRRLKALAVVHKVSPKATFVIFNAKAQGGRDAKRKAKNEILCVSASFA